MFTAAPDRVKAGLLAAFDISVLYRRDLGQVTIRAALTGDTPRTIAALLDDSRTDSDTGTALGQDRVYHSPPAPIRGAIRNVIAQNQAARAASNCARVGWATGGPLPCRPSASRVHATTCGSV